MLALASRRANSIVINRRAAVARRTSLTLLPTAQSGNSCGFVRRWVATLVLGVATFALHSWLHVLRHMHPRNAAQRRVIACACRSHQKVTPQQTNLIVKSSTPTITLGIHCWMHRAQRQHPYCSSVCKQATQHSTMLLHAHASHTSSLHCGRILTMKSGIKAAR